MNSVSYNGDQLEPCNSSIFLYIVVQTFMTASNEGEHSATVSHYCPPQSCGEDEQRGP